MPPTETIADAMEVEELTNLALVDSVTAATDDDDDFGNLAELMDDASTKPAADQIPLLQQILADTEHYSSKAMTLKERAIYDLTKAFCKTQQYKAVVRLLQDTHFFSQVTKAKCARVVRAVLDMVCLEAPNELAMQAEICQNIIDCCRTEKRTFLRQRVEAKLASIWVDEKDFGAALIIVDNLLPELKKLDDKQLLVEIHLLESKVHFGLRNTPKSKAALTASRTCANSIYVSPSLQATIDNMSGVLHCEEGDYDTAHSYFLEAFEQLDQLNDTERAVPCLKYMMLCRILDSLDKALNLSAKGGVGKFLILLLFIDQLSYSSNGINKYFISLTKITGAKSSKADVDISGMISSRQGIKYAGQDIDAMSAIAAAASSRSLKEFEEVLVKYHDELQADLLIKHHLHILQEQLLESNLIRIIEPYSCVEISHIAKLMEMEIPSVEKKISQMILDGKFQGILDQGKGHLIVYEDSEKDMAMEKGLEVIANMDNIVSSLFERSTMLRTMMI